MTRALNRTDTSSTDAPTRRRTHPSTSKGTGGPRLRKWLKHCLGLLVFKSGLHRLLLRGKAVVSVFHRVDDSLEGNPISCTTEEFHAFCRFFRRHMEVISLGELLDRLDRGDRIGSALVISFDDGYRDNRHAAAPILKKEGLSATFFVTTGLIGSAAIPWWDAERNIDSRWMSWEDVRELVAMGFEVGAHTVSHADLSEVGGAEARAEILGSRDRLEKELGVAVPLFSYPYGREDQISDENRAVIRDEGFRCCLSAFGGFVEEDSDPFELRRLPVSPWYMSPYHFGWEMLFRNK